MALDTRRYQSRAAESAPVSISSSALPGLVVLAVGIVIIIAGIILLAAFGIPTNVGEHPKRVSGVAVVGCGALVCLVGILYTLYLKRKAQRELAEKRRMQQAQQQQQYTRPKPHRGGSTGAMTTVSLSSRQMRQQPQIYNNDAYYNNCDYNQYLQQPPQYSTEDYYVTTTDYGSGYPVGTSNDHSSYPYSSRVET